MTTVLVYEWCCGDAAREDSSRAAPLWAEGWAMLSGAVADFRRVAGVQVRTVLGAGLHFEPAVAAAASDWPDVDITWTNDEPAAFRTAAAGAEFALVVAPEFDRILETRCRWAVEAGATLLGPSPVVVALTADKLAMARHFDRHGVLTPETTPARDVWLPAFPTPFVLKLRYGAGSQQLSVCTDRATVRDIADEAAGAGEFILQPLVTGLPASVSFLIGSRRTHVLPPTEQFVSVPGNFRYLGGRVPLLDPLADRAVRVAGHAAAAVSELNGYIGVDVILGHNPDGSRDFAVEINPRLTTSYVGLRALCEDNLMEMLLRLVRGEAAPQPRWRAGGVSWTPAGEIRAFTSPTNLAAP
jgi:predicted ATP-grasp superfamily ATP-dependent carboligase